MVQSRKPDSQLDTPLERAMCVLRTLVSRGKPSSLDEITQDVNLPRPTVYRLLTSLTSLRLLEKDPATRRYGIGLQMINLAQQVSTPTWPSIERRKILEDLVNDIGETCNFVVRSGNRILWLDRVETQDPVRLHLEPGLTVPLFCTATGKLYLSYMTENSIIEILNTEPLTKYTDKTVNNLPDLLKELVQIRKTRVSIDHGEYIPNIAAIAVPVENRSGQLVAALSAHGPSYRFSQATFERFIPKLRAAAAKISNQIFSAK